MQRNTYNQYLSLAEHFYRTRLRNLSPTPKRLCDALKRAAGDYRPAYWRRLRKAIELDQCDKGFKQAAKAVAETKNPITVDPDRKAEIKPKQRRAKSVSEKDELRLMQYLNVHNEHEVYDAVLLTKYLGCRPAELRDLSFDGRGNIEIYGAKKRDDRGLDRIVIISESDLYHRLMTAHKRLIKSSKKDPVRYVQKRLASIAARLWTQRIAKPSLYSFRHQFGADLKASGKSAREVAAVMGHRSTESIAVYGNRRLSRHSRAYLSVAESSLAKVHHGEPKPPYSVQALEKRKQSKHIAPTRFGYQPESRNLS